MSTPLEFVVISESDYINKKFNVYYVLWNGNEEALMRLEKAISRSLERYEDSNLGEYLKSFSINLEVKVPESVADLHCDLTFKNSPFPHLFKACKGRFNWFYDEDDDIDKEAFDCMIGDELYLCAYRGEKR